MLGLGVQIPRRVLVVKDHSVSFARHAADVRAALKRKLVRLAAFVREQLVQETTEVIFPVRVHLFRRRRKWEYRLPTELNVVQINEDRGKAVGAPGGRIPVPAWCLLVIEPVQMCVIELRRFIPDDLQAVAPAVVPLHA
jgi:hypothetical protein